MSAGGQTRIAWLAPFDLSQVASRFDPPLQGPNHNSPWITNGSRALVESGGVDLHIVTYDKRLRNDLTFTDHGMTFHLIRTAMPAIPRAATFYQLDLGPFLRTLNAIKPDVVHGHGTENIYSYAAVKSRYPHVISIQALLSELVRTHRTFSRDWCQQSLVRFVERYTLRRARRVFVKAPFVEALIRPFNPSMSIELADNIVSAPFFSVRRDASPVAKRIMFVGRLTETKGVGELVQAFHQVATSDLKLELHLIGQGHPSYVRGRLRSLIEAGPAARRVIMRGHLRADQLAPEYADAAMLVLPSYYDTSPNVIAEAMVAGVPVIGTTVGGVPYMLDDGANGQLVPPGDVEALAEAIRNNLRAPDAAAVRAGRGQMVGRRRHSKELFVSRMLRMYACASAAPAVERVEIRP